MKIQTFNSSYDLISTNSLRFMQLLRCTYITMKSYLKTMKNDHYKNSL